MPVSRPKREGVLVEEVDGQVLVLHDMVGLTQDFSPRFLRRYADVQGIMNEAIGQYVTDVKSGDFPNETEQY
jgi:3-methyl-2-oxobutanoate hydroxymethyltransferase